MGNRDFQGKNKLLKHTHQQRILNKERYLIKRKVEKFAKKKVNMEDYPEKRRKNQLKLDIK